MIDFTIHGNMEGTATGTVSALHAIIIPVERHTWAYYTDDHVLYTDFLTNGFCGMTASFRDQFIHTCDGPLTAEATATTLYLPWWAWFLLFICMLFSCMAAGGMVSEAIDPNSEFRQKIRSQSVAARMAARAKAPEDSAERGEYVAASATEEDADVSAEQDSSDSESSYVDASTPGTSAAEEAAKCEECGKHLR